MTFLKDTKPPAIAPSPRRATESPRFWIILGVGSIALHILLLLGLRWMSLRASLTTATTDPTPIELIEISPDALAPADEGVDAAPPPAANQPAASAPPAAPPDTTSPPPAAPVPEIAAAPPEVTEPPIAPLPEPSATPTPPSPLPPLDVAPSPSEPSVQPSAPTQPPEAIEPTPEQPNPTPNTTGSADSSADPSDLPTVPVDGFPADGSGLPNIPTTEQGVPSEQPQEGGGQSDGGLITGLPEVPTYQPPQSFAASLSVGAPQNDIPGSIAEPIESSRSYVNDGSQSSCQATPDVAAHWGTPLTFRVVIDTDPNNPTVGYVSDEDGLTLIGNSSGSSDYDSLAECLLREWTFRPPDTDAIQEAPSSEVIVTVQITPG